MVCFHVLKGLGKNTGLRNPGIRRADDDKVVGDIAVEYLVYAGIEHVENAFNVTKVFSSDKNIFARFFWIPGFLAVKDMIERTVLKLG